VSQLHHAANSSDATAPLSFLTTTGRRASGDWRPARLDCRRSRRGGERSPTARVISPISIASGLRSCTDRSCNAPGRSGARSVRAAPLEPETSWPSARRRSPGPGGHQPTARVLRPRPRTGASTDATGQTPRERVAALFEEGHSVPSVAQQLGVDVENRRQVVGPLAAGARARAVRRRPLAVLGRPAARRRPPDRGQLAGPLARRRRGGVGVPEGPRASDSRPPAAADRAGTSAGASRPRLRRRSLERPLGRGGDRAADLSAVDPQPGQAATARAARLDRATPTGACSGPDASDQPGTFLSSRARGLLADGSLAAESCAPAGAPVRPVQGA
jgi:hypothetical protein